MASSFEECAGFSKACAAALAPGVVQKMRFTGFAVTNECAKEMQTVQKSEKRMKEIAKCEAEEGLAKQMLEELNAQDLDAAVKVAEDGLEKCIGFENQGCESQLAPVIVNQLVQRAVQQTQVRGSFSPEADYYRGVRKLGLGWFKKGSSEVNLR